MGPSDGTPMADHGRQGELVTMLNQYLSLPQPPKGSPFEKGPSGDWWDRYFALDDRLRSAGILNAKGQFSPWGLKELFPLLPPSSPPPPRPPPGNSALARRLEYEAGSPPFWRPTSLQHPAARRSPGRIARPPRVLGTWVWQKAQRPPAEGLSSAPRWGRRPPEQPVPGPGSGQAAQLGRIR